VWSGATAACAFASGFTALLAARVGVGVGQAGFGPAGAALLAAAYPRDRRATVLGAFQAGGPLGIVVGAVAGSLVAAVVVDVVPANVRATATSMYVLVQNLLGLAVGPVLTGALADRWGLTTALTAVAGLGLGAACALGWGSRFYARDRGAAVLSPPSTGRVDGRQAAAVRPTRRRIARGE
jgi:MFS family permease